MLFVNRIATLLALLGFMLLFPIASNAKVDVQFEKHGKRYHLSVPINGIALTDQSNPLFIAMTAQDTVDVETQAIVIEESSWNNLQAGKENALKYYLMVGIEKNERSRGSVDNFLRQIERDLEAQKGHAIPELGGPAVQMGYSVSEYEHTGPLVKTSNAIGSVNRVVYLDRGGEVALSPTIGTLITTLDGRIFYIIIVKQDADDQSINEIADIMGQLVLRTE